MVLGGCGLTLDYDPPDDGGTVGFDARPRADGSSAGSCDADDDCDDGDPCNGLETCAGGHCASGSAPECADSIACTADACDSTQGCGHTPDDGLCEDDGIACTIERCDSNAGCQRELDHASCDDGIACTDDVCDPAQGCRHDPIDARCGRAVCDASAGCVGTECTADADCMAGPCDAEVACVDGTCVRTPVPDDTACDDGNPCTATSICSGGACRGIERSACPGQPCVLCNPLGDGCDGTRFAPAGAICDDANHCTTGDACDGSGSCIAAATIACVSTSTCTISICNPGTGVCDMHDTTGPCEDGDRCTTGDFCSSGRCMPGTAMDCSDGNSCTSDMCNPSTGCEHSVVLGSSCDDGDPCTMATVCQADRTCGGGVPRCLDDANPCVIRSCNPSISGCAMTFVDGACPNGTCALGECVCDVGFADCDGDGSCECELYGNFCSSRRCMPAPSCTDSGVDCPPGTMCCTCRGGMCTVPEICECPST